MPPVWRLAMPGLDRPALSFDVLAVLVGAVDAMGYRSSWLLLGGWTGRGLIRRCAMTKWRRSVRSDAPVATASFSKVAPCR